MKPEDRQAGLLYSGVECLMFFWLKCFLLLKARDHILWFFGGQGGTGGTTAGLKD